MDFPSIDLFATRLNHRLPIYVSPIPDQKALSIDALSMDWNRIHAYAFPPFHLIPAVINKIQFSQCKIVLIATLWPDRPWLFYLSVKTVFLVTLATARRVSEVHALSMDSDHLRFSNLDSSLILRTQLGFLAKNQLPSRALDSIKIPKLSNLCRKSDSFNRMLCPVRAVKIYLNKTKSLRKHRKRLFIPTQGDHDLNKSTISRWVKYAIKHAYGSISKNPNRLFNPRAHELRAISAY